MKMGKNIEYWKEHDKAVFGKLFNCYSIIV